MAKPKLALLPAAQGSKFYSVLPSSGIGDFSFTRNTSATRINKDGYIESVPALTSRLNYPLIDGVVKGCPSHILEPARTNLVTYSEDFSGWNGGHYTTPNYAISPDGTLNASRLLFTGASQVLLKTTSLASGVSCSATFYVKGNAGETIQLAAGGIDTMHTLNGSWQRLETNQTSANSTILLNTFGGSTARDLLIWGAQLEQGSYITSYIPTNGSAVTRGAETAANAGDASTFNDSEGVLMAEISALADDGTYRFISLSDGTSSNRVSLFLSNTNTLNGSANGVSSIASVVDIKNNNKVAYKYKSGDYSLWVNGFEAGTLTVTTGNHANLNRLNFDYGQGSDDFYGNAKQIQYFDSADIDLETLTSWVSFSDMAESQLYSIK